MLAGDPDEPPYASQTSPSYRSPRRRQFHPRHCSPQRTLYSASWPLSGLPCEAYQNRALRNLPCRKIQCDEIWSFCYAKQKNVPKEKQGQFGFGDVWTWTAFCADTKLICSW